MNPIIKLSDNAASRIKEIMSGIESMQKKLTHQMK